MIYLGFYLGRHDSNLCLFDTSTHRLTYTKSERVFNIKRHRADLSFVTKFCEDRSFYPDIVAFTDGNRNGLGSCPEQEVITELTSAPAFSRAKWLNIDHHLAHVLSAWPILPSDKIDVGVAIDGQGDHLRRVSVFRKPFQLKAPTFTSSEYEIGHFFVQIGLLLKLSGQLDDYAGKIMGAQAYGTPDTSFVENHLETGVERDMHRLFRITEWKGAKVSSSFFSLENQAFRDWLASVHLIASKVIGSVLKQHCEPDDTIVYSGGCALNTVSNYSLFCDFPRLVIPPNCYDGGISLGCIEAARIFLSEEPMVAKGFPFIQADEDFGIADEATIRKTAKCLAEGQIVGWLQGNGEIGPRALGHRSILVRPSGNSTKDMLNEKVKKREYWRPFAPSIKWSAQQRYIMSDMYSPYMLKTAPVCYNMRTAIPAVVHMDGTARYQSVDAGRIPELEAFEKLLDEFERLTGAPVLLNTSYNAGGMPIVSKHEHALELFNSTQIDVLVTGNKIHSKK